MSFYFDKQRLEKKRRNFRLRFYIGLALFLFLTAGLFYSIVYSPIFKIKKWEIDFRNKEQSHSLFDDLKKFLRGRSFVASFLGPDNILIWKQKSVDDFINSHPEIEKIDIKKDYSQGAVTIKIYEKGRFGVWCMINPSNGQQVKIDDKQVIIENLISFLNETSCWWIDKKGVVLAEAPFLEGNLINKIGDYSERQLKIGEVVLENNLFGNLVEIFNVLNESSLKVKSLKIENIELEEVVVDPLNNFFPIIYFSLRNSPNFSLAAFEYLNGIGLKNVQYIDLRVENRVYYKLR